jgi:hypothetical protein
VSAALILTSPFDRWTGDVSTFLIHYAGRSLAEAPDYILRGLPEWHARGWRAQDVADRLADCRWPAQATLVEFYTDPFPKQVLVWLAERFRAYEVM